MCVLRVCYNDVDKNVFYRNVLSSKSGTPLNPCFSYECIRCGVCGCCSESVCISDVVLAGALLNARIMRGDMSAMQALWHTCSLRC